MKFRSAVSTSTCRPEWILAACAAALLSACGGSGGDDASGSQKTATGLSAEIASGTTAQYITPAAVDERL